MIKSNMPPLLTSDLEHIFIHTEFVWEELRNETIFITGGTGFFGTWILESFVWANEKLKLNAKALILTRNIDRFKKKCPHLYLNSSLLFEEGDVTNFKFPSGNFSHIIHAATEVSSGAEGNNTVEQIILKGTQHVLKFAQYCGTKRLLFVSSGAVYGPIASCPVSENSFQEPYSLDHLSSYALGKRKAEKLCASFKNQSKLEVKIARCFAFVGPYLPLDAHFAIGNFILNGLKNQSIRINGNGTSQRSYLYAADLTIWLWTILFRGLPFQPYNVGSEETITIKELAYLIADCFDSSIKVYIDNLYIENSSNYYVPNTMRAYNELNLTQQVNLKKAVQTTINWYSFLR